MACILSCPCYSEADKADWNIPKHLARFTFTGLPDKAVSITVTPLDENTTTPFFTATFKPIPYVPSFPASTSIAKYIGLDLDLVQPPLPEGKGTEEELPGTDRWCKITPYQSSRKVSLGWWDMKQEAMEEDSLLANEEISSGANSGNKNWWPGSGRWRIGMIMEDADIGFPEGEYWKGPNL